MMSEENFTNTHRRAKAATRTFVDAISNGDNSETDNADQVISDVVRAGGECVLGIWEELHRIADQLEYRDSFS